MPVNSNNGDDQDIVLLVDDDPSNLAILRETLKARPYRLLMAKSGEQALTIAAKARPVLVLLDIMMPGIDGFETCRRLQEQPETADVVVIFLSALDEAKDKVRGLELGAVDFISKPFDPDEVIARVETHLKILRLEHNLVRNNRALEDANARMNSDLQAAARVQQSFLPRSLPDIEGAHLEWHYRPCQELAGDYLNVLALDSHRIGMYVVDVCGHGVPSSLLAVQVARDLVSAERDSLLITADGSALNSPAEVATRLNRMYPMDDNAGLYFTFLYAVLDTRDRQLRYVSAGNPGPVQVGVDGAVQVHDAPALPIGLFADAQYEDSILSLNEGDRIYLHSDGLSEERNADGEMFGMEQIEEVLRARRGESLSDSLESVVAQVIDWQGSEHLSDDIAVLALELQGSA
jgi:sigma-B regulation protein RsbU (phosphoserine phosphatase)